MFLQASHTHCPWTAILIQIFPKALSGRPVWLKKILLELKIYTRKNLIYPHKQQLPLLDLASLSIFRAT
jgi:hypothetical protein